MPFVLKNKGLYSYFSHSDGDSAGIVHGFCTRSSPFLLDKPDGPGDFLSTFSLSDVVSLGQEHRDTIHVIGHDRERPGTGDGLILRERGIAGTIRTADCVPVILYDASLPLAAIVHAGWRGTAMRIAGKAARLMVDLGARPGRIRALIGPSIGPCCYEVKGDVVSAFRMAGFSEDIFLYRDGAVFLDLQKANREDLEGQGMGGFDVLDLCTRCDSELFYSARRGEAGRQVSFVALSGSASGEV